MCKHVKRTRDVSGATQSERQLRGNHEGTKRLTNFPKNPKSRWWNRFVGSVHGLDTCSGRLWFLSGTNTYTYQDTDPSEFHAASTYAKNHCRDGYTNGHRDRDADGSSGGGNANAGASDRDVHPHRDRDTGATSGRADADTGTYAGLDWCT